MAPNLSNWLDVRASIREALAEDEPVVALESTVIAHGLPYPLNLETARACEEAVREAGGIPATIAVIGGRARIGLTADEIETIAVTKRESAPIEKVGLNNLAAVLAGGRAGATTVAASLKLAHAAGIRVFSTGGIGGVHREAAETFDVSADLTALASTPIICVCAGAKAILDLPKTVEYLETLGVPIVGFRTNEFPAFYTRRSGLRVDVAAQTPEEAARIAALHWEVSSSAVLVCVPVPEKFEMGYDEVEQAISTALSRSREHGIRGKAVTPFVLAQLEKLTAGRSLDTNRALLVNNAAVAAKIARCFTD